MEPPLPTVLVVGGSSGTGKAVARAAAESGAFRVVIAARSAERLAAAAEISNGAVETAVLDAADDAALAAFFAARGNGAFKHVAVTRRWRKRGRLSLRGQLGGRVEGKLFVQMAVAHPSAPLVANGGSITFVSGALAERPGKSSSVLASTNATIDALGRALAQTNNNPRSQI